MATRTTITAATRRSTDTQQPEQQATARENAKRYAAALAHECLPSVRARAETAPERSESEQSKRERARAQAAHARAEGARKQRIQRYLVARRIPHVAAVLVAVLATLGWAVHRIVRALGADPYLVPLIAAGLPVAAVAVLIAARREATRGWWSTLAAGGLAAAGVIAWISTAGWGWPQLAALAAAHTGIGARWWAAHPIGPDAPTETPTPEPAPDPASAPQPAAHTPAEVVIARWRDNIAGPQGALPGSRLTAAEEFDHGLQFLVELAPGKHDLEMVRSRMGLLATGIGYHRQHLLFEGFSADSEVPPWRVRLRIVTANPVAQPQYFTEPRVSNGLAEIGPHADGDGVATWPFWTKEGMRNGVLIGSTGSGKGGVSGVLATSARATGRLNLLYVDPQGGMSSPEIAARATISLLGKQQTGRAIEVIEALADGREDYGSQSGRSKFLPTPDMPGWAILVDESHHVLRKQAELWTDLVSRCRKLGMCVIVMTQYPGLTAFAGSEHLRSSLAWNYIALKTRSKSSGDLIPGLTQDPATLPDQPGYGLIGGGARSDVALRCQFLPTADDELREEPPLRLGDALEAHPEPAACALDQASLTPVIGQPDGHGRWHRTSTRSGRTTSQPAPSSTATPAGKGPAGGFGLTLVEGPTETAPTPAPAATGPTLSETQRGVLEAIRDGHTRPVDIAASCGWGRTAIHDALSQLADLGHITNHRHGHWHLTNTETSAA